MHTEIKTIKDLESGDLLIREAETYAEGKLIGRFYKINRPFRTDAIWRIVLDTEIEKALETLRSHGLEATAERADIGWNFECFRDCILIA